MAFAREESFSNKDIVFPVGKKQIENFLQIAKSSQNQSLVKFPAGKVLYTEIPQEGSATFGVGADTYMLYWDDFNNDGKKEYFLIYLMSGSGNYSGVTGAYFLDGAKLSSLKFDEIVVENLFPGKDMSRFHSYLARPFAVYKNGKIALRFIADEEKSGIATYVWDIDKFSKLK